MNEFILISAWRGAWPRTGGWNESQPLAEQPLVCIRPELFSPVLRGERGCQWLQMTSNLCMFRPDGHLCCAGHCRRKQYEMFFTRTWQAPEIPGPSFNQLLGFRFFIDTAFLKKKHNSTWSLDTNIHSCWSLVYSPQLGKFDVFEPSIQVCLISLHQSFSAQACLPSFGRRGRFFISPCKWLVYYSGGPRSLETVYRYPWTELRKGLMNNNTQVKLRWAWMLPLWSWSIIVSAII